MTSGVTAVMPSSAAPLLNSSPDVHAESASPSNAKNGEFPSAELDEVTR